MLNRNSSRMPGIDDSEACVQQQGIDYLPFRLLRWAKASQWLSIRANAACWLS